ncbi:MAG: response regulator [Chloroflexota bacterium]
MRTKKRKILVIDDEPINLGVLFDYLRSVGFRVWLAEDGEQGLEVLSHSRPDLILLDLEMPGLTGFEVCQQIKQNEAIRDIPVIFLTARADTVDKVKGFQVGAVDYITKPIEVEEVHARVNTHLTIYDQQQAIKAQLVELQNPTSTIEHDLNERELEVLRLFAAGESRANIAKQLFISLNTVKWYIKNIYSKLGVNRKADAIAIARQLGL